nr:MAG TPA: hypothetical protein [Caudoviricetes sp.]
MRPLGDWDALPDGFQFQSGGVGEDFIDMVSVKSEGALLWWSCKRSHAKTKDTRPNVDAPFWELGQNLKFVATDLLLAKKAFIENLGVRNVETRNAQGEVTFKAEENGEIKAKGGTFDSIHIEGDSSFNKLKAINEKTGEISGKIQFQDDGISLAGSTVYLKAQNIICDLVEGSAEGYNIFDAQNLHARGTFSARKRATAVVTSQTISYYILGTEYPTVYYRQGQGNVVPMNVPADGRGRIYTSLHEASERVYPNFTAVDVVIVSLDSPEVLKIDMLKAQKVRLINVSDVTIRLDLGAGGKRDVGEGGSVTLFGLFDLGGKDEGIWVIH